MTLFVEIGHLGTLRSSTIGFVPDPLQQKFVPSASFAADVAT
jgi:hypothetical protein